MPCPGWSDTEGASDQHTFKDLLRHLQKEKLTCIKVFSGFVCVCSIEMTVEPSFGSFYFRLFFGS